MKKLMTLLAIVLMLSVFGCAGADSRQNAIEYSGTEDVKVAAPETSGQEQQQEELVLSFVGDMMFDKSVASFIKANGADYIFQGYESYFKRSDIIFGNLETPLSNRGQQIVDKEYTFRSSPAMAPYLRKNNFTALSIANNHIMDYGTVAFNDTMRNLRENGISFGGGGFTRQEAESGVIIEKKGMKIGFIAFSRVTPKVEWYAGKKKPGIIGAYKVHEKEVLEAVKSLDARCDLLVVSLHWGKEGSTVVRKEESELAHKLIDSGVDVVMGHHPHVVQAIEVYNGKPIFYSLGNFFFTTSKAEICNKTIMATTRFDSKGKLKSVEAVPGIIKLGRPFPMEEVKKAEYLEYLNKMNVNIKL